MTTLDNLMKWLWYGLKARVLYLLLALNGVLGAIGYGIRALLGLNSFDEESIWVTTGAWGVSVAILQYFFLPIVLGGSKILFGVEMNRDPVLKGFLVITSLILISLTIQVVFVLVMKTAAISEREHGLTLSMLPFIWVSTVVTVWVTLYFCWGLPTNGFVSLVVTMLPVGNIVFGVVAWITAEVIEAVVRKPVKLTLDR